MRHFLLLITLLAALILPKQLFAQYVLPFEARKVSHYFSRVDLYTITDLYDNYFFDVVSEKSDKAPALWDLIIKVNGKNVSTNDNLLELFQEKAEVDLVLGRLVNGDFCWFNSTIRPKNNTKGYGDLLDNIKYSVERRAKEGLESSPQGLRIISKPNLDFYDYSTYDILITGNDPLVDEKIINMFCSSGLLSQMRRDEENPDIIICLSKSASESISSTYVPPTTSVVNTGSTTRPVYNYITRTVSYETKQHNRYEHTEGYTQTTTATSIHLEFSILDAKKMNDPNQRTAPIIWQMIYNRNVANRDFEILDEYMAIASWNCFPFTEPKISESYSFVMTGVGMKPLFSEEASMVVTDAVPGSPADKIGLKKNDRIVRVDGKKSYTVESGTQYWSAGAYMMYKNGIDREKTKEGCFMIASCAQAMIIKTEYFRHDFAYHKDRGFTMYHEYDSPLYRTAEYTILRDGSQITLTGRLLGPHKGLSKPKLCHRIAVY